MHLPFWLSCLALSPLLAWQAYRTRRNTPRLPDAGGATSGQWGPGDARRRIAVLGESTAAGVGVTTHQQGLASQIARCLHLHNGQTVAWHSRGTNGIRLQALLQTLDDHPLPQSDAWLLSMGVNDTTGLTPRHRYRQQLLALQQQLAPAPLYLCAVPPMHRFTALPAPLRQLLGWRARQLDRIQKQLARQYPHRFCYLGYPPINDPTLLAEDGYHPGKRGYQAMARALAGQLALHPQD